MKSKENGLVKEVVKLPLKAPKVSSTLGRVSLVGAGPGDPELLTIKALRSIQSADLIVYDRLVSEEICQLFPDATPRIYVGKAKNHHSTPQDQINQLLLEHARQGKNICRLKGGDAFVFGRGGEEMLLLKQSGVAVEIIPGITAGAGCTSYAGIPLTHRGLSQGCTFVTAHAETELAVDWQSLAQIQHTLVFYMGLSKADFIATNLVDNGLSKHTPVALIENGCCPQQRVICGELDQLASLVELNQVQSPALIVVGKVVSLAEQLDWFKSVAQQQAEFSPQQLAQLSA